MYMCVDMHAHVRRSRGKCWVFPSIPFQLSLNLVHKSVSLIAQRTLVILLPLHLSDVGMPCLAFHEGVGIHTYILYGHGPSIY